jgi:competence protein ComEC
MSEMPRASSPVADLWFLNVGQGDCTLIIDRASRQTILIDCPTRHVDSLKATLLKEGLEIYAAIVTHWDLDHYGGLARISGAVRTNHVYYNHDTLFPEGKPEYGKYIKTTLQAFLDLTRFGTELHSMRYQDELNIGEVKLRFLAPTQAEVTQAYLAGRRNVASAVVAVEVGSLRALIGGDAVAATWRRLLASPENLLADILRWPHHGAVLHGGSEDLIDSVLATVNPERIIISTGFGNRYLHPSQEVISRSQGQLAHVYCTQVTGRCFGYITKAEEDSEGAQLVLSTVTAPACADTIRVTISDSDIDVSPSDKDHAARVKGWPAPLCQLHHALPSVL